jgi:hypothetical protein
VATSFPSSTDLRFSIAGLIASWDPFGRWLRIGVRNFWLAPGVSVAGLAPGASVTATGHQDDTTARWIVTQLTVTGPPR